MGLLDRFFGRAPVDAQADVRPAADLRALKIPAPAVVDAAPNLLDRICAEFSATYTRVREADGTVVLRAHLADGDVVTARAATTPLAVDALSDRLVAHRNALAEAKRAAERGGRA